MGRELVAALVVLLHLLLVDGSNLSKLVLVISVLDGRAVLAKTLSWGLALVRTCNGEREKGYKMPDAMVHIKLTLHTLSWPSQIKRSLKVVFTTSSSLNRPTT